MTDSVCPQTIGIMNIKTLLKYGSAAFCALLLSCSAYCQSEATQLAEEQYKKADAELNKTYGELLDTLKDKRIRDDFEKARSAWISFRESDAKARAGLSSDGGSAYAMDYYANMTEATQQRTAQLMVILRALNRQP